MDPTAFEEFFRREFTPLVGFLRKAGFGQDAAEDAAASAMLRGYQSWAKINSAPKAWLRTTAYRMAVHETRRTRDGVLRAVAGGWATNITQDEDPVEFREEHDLLLELLDQLPPRQRLVMCWHLDEFDNNEISEHLQMSPATVRSNLRHARDRLAIELSRRNGRVPALEEEHVKGGE